MSPARWKMWAGTQPAGARSRRPAGFLRLGGLLGALLAVARPVGAQGTGTIAGRVMDAVTRAPIPNAEVRLAETNVGALTRQDGRFQLINVPAGQHQVQARIVGFRPSTAQVAVRAGQETAVSFDLRVEVIALDEVVVTGLPVATRRKELGTAVTQVSLADVEARPTATVEALLQARSTGIQSFQHEGQVGASGLLQLRGVKSVSQGNEPLVYVDGVRMATSRTPAAAAFDGRNTRVSSFSWNDINPANIERIEIIKGAAATSLYGTEASAGVIQIFTKRGTQGRAQWSADATQGANFWPVPSSVVRQHPTSLDIDVVKRTGHVQKYGGSVRGGIGDIDYFLGGSMSDEKGIVDTQRSKAVSASANFGMSLFEGATVRLSNSYSHRRTRQVPDGNNRYGLMINVLRVGGGYKAGARDQSWVLEQEYFNELDNFLSGLELSFQHSQFRHTLRFGLHQLESSSSGLQPFQWLLNPQGTISERLVSNRLVTGEYSGTWEQSLFGSLRSTFSVGGQVYDEMRHTVQANGQNFPGPGQHTVSSASLRSAEETRIRQVNAGFFAQEVLGFQDRLFLTGGVRVDGSSSFGEDYGFQVYPKVSLSYVPSDLTGWPAWWSSFRVRGAVGMAGKAPGAFDAVRTWNPISAKNGQPGLSPGNVGNPELGPEKTVEVEAGFDSDMFGGSLTLEFTWYRATTQDGLFNVTQVPTLGFLSSQLYNVGKLRSTGLELLVHAVPLDTRLLNWGVGAGITTTNSKVVDMGGSAPFSTGSNAQIREGYAPPSFFGRRITNPDAIADPVFETDAYLGDVLPNLTVNLNTDVSLGAVTFAAVGEMVKGGHVRNSVAWLNAVREVWPGCTAAQAEFKANGSGKLTALQRAQCLTQFIGADMFIESWDFFKLRNLGATVRLPQQFVPRGLGSATLSVTGVNLFKISDYTGIDPESHEGGGDVTYRDDYYTVPPMRSFLAKLSFTF